MTARTVNSAGDSVAGTYGWKAGVAPSSRTFVVGCAMRRDGSIEPCERIEQAPAGPRSGLRAHDEPAVDLSPLPERARWRRRGNHFVPGPRRAVPAQCGPDPEGPRVLR